MNMEAKREEAARIVAHLSIKEKIKLCSGRDMWYLESVHFDNHYLPPVMITDGPHGLRKQKLGDATDLLKDRIPATCFPTASCLACSWDEDLLCAVGVALANECIKENVAVLLGPGMNIKRHPCGGRNFEYLSEDPLLSGRLATSIVKGIQSQGVGTSIKHFCVNNQERKRMRVDVIVDERSLHEIYYRGFEHCIKSEHQPTTIMCAYNKINGVFCSENAPLWNMVRDDWGFQGAVITDWGAVSDRVKGINAGVDLEMPGSKGAFDPEIRKAVSSRNISVEQLDAIVARNVTLSLLGLEVLKRDVDVSHYDHRELAESVAMQCAVLLKNDDNLLPLAADTSVAIIGDFAKHPRYQGMGSSQVNPTKVDCAWDSIPHYSSNATYAQGYHHDGDADNADLIQEAVKVAKNAAVALIFCGLPEIYESEGFDRSHINMPATHNALIEAVATANPRTIVILSNGSPVTMPWVDKVGAIIEGYLAGQAGGAAVVDLIFGAASPCGKLAETFPLCQADVACNDYFPGDNQVEYREGLNIGYRYYDTAKKEVLFPFGHGLSYTEFEYKDFEANVLDDEFRVQVKFTLTNVGSVPAAEVVQCYVHDEESKVYRPEQELKEFTKAWLNPQEHEVVEFTLEKEAFSFYDVGRKNWIVEPGAFEIRIGASSRDIRLRAKIEISKGDVPSAAAQLAWPPVDDISCQVSDERFCRMLQIEELPQPRKKVRPFHRCSLTSELKHSLSGRLIRRAVFHFAIDEMEDASDPAQRRMVEELVDNMPLKGLVIFSQGTVIFEDLDTMIALLNWNFIKAATHIWPGIKRRCKKKAKPSMPLGSALRMSMDA